MEIVNLCETCVYFKKRDTTNCPIQQNLHTSDIISQTTSIIIKCRIFKKK